MRASLRLSLAAATAAALVLLVASPAAAAGRTMPATDAMYAIGCDDSYPSLQLVGVDAATAVSTEIGTGSGGNNCAYQPAWDATTSTAYYIVGDFPTSILATIDTATGVTTQIGTFTDAAPDPDVTPFIEAIAIGLDGLAYGYSETDFYSIDLATGGVTELGAVGTEILGFGVDPTTGLFYAADVAGNVYSVDVTNGSLLLVGTVTVGNVLYSMQIDSAGTFWFSSFDETDEVNQLWSSAPTFAGTEQLSGTFLVDGDQFFHEALLIAPNTVTPAVVPAALPNTGSEAPNAVLIGGASVLVLLGLVLVLRRRTA